MTTSISIIGSGFSGLSAGCYLAQAGFKVTIFEKNNLLGGRARSFESDGFTFDMGPSWYWMPDVFDRFFADFGKKTGDFYRLSKLDPGFRIYYGRQDFLDIPADTSALRQLFEDLESGAGDQLDKFLADAKYKYEVGMKDLVYKPGLSITEFLDWRVIRSIFKLHMTTPFDKFVSKYFKHPKLRQLMEFPILFLGAAPAQTPALYSLMNFAGLSMGTFYPKGGMKQIISAMTKLARELGVTILSNHEVQQIMTENKTVRGLQANGTEFPSKFVVSSADYHHTESKLLAVEKRNYDEAYWDSRTMAPSSLLFYLGVDQKVPGLLHHTLFFDHDLTTHANEIYTDPKWPTNPLFYTCCPSKTDESTAPPDAENLFILMPLAAGIKDTDELRAKYFRVIINRLQNILDVNIESHIIYKRSYCIRDFASDYHAFKGNAYGLANTLRQTAILKPRIKNRHIQNLYYTGHLTVPGPGVPPSIISGKVVADQIIQKNNR
ncbi:MAG: phytoene desaturase [Saprospiraceae bacterium]|nr:phytoene desaturase [Saprospiraceae bacterium]